MLRQLLDQIRAYLDGYSTLDDLETWLLSNLGNILASGDKTAEYIANELDADLVWLREGLITEKEFKARAERLLRPALTASTNLTWVVSFNGWFTPTSGGEFKMTEAKEAPKCSASPATVIASVSAH
jgi:hypothetical protein